MGVPRQLCTLSAATRPPASSPASFIWCLFVPVCVQWRRMRWTDETSMFSVSFLPASFCLSMMIVMVVAGNDDACTEIYQCHLYLYVKIPGHVLYRDCYVYTWRLLVAFLVFFVLMFLGTFIQRLLKVYLTASSRFPCVLYSYVQGYIYIETATCVPNGC